MPEKITSVKMQTGFTLVEVLIAMLILLVGLLGIASMQIMAMKGNQHARESTEKTVTANSFMEWLVGLPFDSDNLRVDDDALDPDVAVVRHSATPVPGASPTMEAEFDDGSTDALDTAPPDNLIPQGGANDIERVNWTVEVASWEDAAAGGTVGSYDLGEETSKRITVTVVWESGNKSATISNIKSNAE